MARKPKANPHGFPPPPMGNKRALVHGMYSDCVMPSERPLLLEVDIGSVDSEIRIEMIRLRRASIADAKQDAIMEAIESCEERADADKIAMRAMILMEANSKSRVVTDRAGAITSRDVERQQKRGYRDFDRRLSACTLRLKHLVTIRINYLVSAPGVIRSPSETAAAVREEMARLLNASDDMFGDA